MGKSIVDYNYDNSYVCAIYNNVTMRSVTTPVISSDSRHWLNELRAYLRKDTNNVFNNFPDEYTISILDLATLDVKRIPMNNLVSPKKFN